MQYIINEKSLEYHWDILGRLWNEIYEYQNESNVLITRNVSPEKDMKIVKNAQFIRALSNIDHFDDVNEMSFLQSPLLFSNATTDDISVDTSRNVVNIQSKNYDNIAIDRSSQDLSVDDMFVSSMIASSIALNDNKKLSSHDDLDIVISSDEGSVNVSSMKEEIFAMRSLIERVMQGFLNKDEMQMLWTKS